MAVSRLTTIGSTSFSSTDTDLSISHTVDAGTTLLVVSITLFSGEDSSVAPQWSLGGGEDLTLVTDVDASSGTHTWTYALVNPTAGAGTITITVTSSVCGISTAINYDGTVTTSVANAIQLLEEDNNGSPDGNDEQVFASAGTSGNALYAAGGFRGGDGSPVSLSGSFTAVFNDNTGSNSTSDLSYYVAELLDGAPSALTVTFAASDENAGHLLEIVAAGGSSFQAAWAIHANKIIG